MVCNAAKMLEQNPEWALQLYVDWMCVGIFNGRTEDYCTQYIRYTYR